MSESQKKSPFRFQLLSAGHYLDALLFWSIYASSSMLILWLMTSIAKNQIREVLIKEFVNITQLTTQYVAQYPGPTDPATRRFLATVAATYPEITAIAVVRLENDKLSYLTAEPALTHRIGLFDSEEHLASIQTIKNDRRVAISDWPTFTSERASILTSRPNDAEFLYARINPADRGWREGEHFLVVALDANAVQFGFYKIEELGINAIGLAILFGTVIAVFVRIRSAQRLEANEKRLEALESLRRRDAALNILVQGADRIFADEALDPVFDSVLRRLQEELSLDFLFCGLQDLSVASDQRSIGNAPKDLLITPAWAADNAPDWNEVLLAGGVLRLPRQRTPSAFRRWLAVRQITMVAIIGLLVEGKLVGLLVAGGNGKIISDAVVDTLKLVADIFANAYRQRLQDERMRESSKMEALGRMAGGVAHEFNNLLHIIIGNLRLDPPVKESKDNSAPQARVLEAAQRGAAIVENLLQATRMNKPILRQCKMDEVVLKTINLATAALGAGIHIQSHLKAHDAEAMMDQGQITQVLLNLLLNARDSMKGSGVINVTTGVSGTMVFCRVEDSGPGVAPDLFEKIFEPFFTTKDPGKGTGLGLPTSRGIMQQHGGTLTLEIAPAVAGRRSQGACFQFSLPRAETPSANAASEAPNSSAFVNPAPLSPRRVWIADDERLCRDVLRDCLLEMGMHVEACASGDELLQRLRTEIPDARTTAEWIIIDWTMPGLHGASLISALRKAAPASRIIVTSGFAFSADEHSQVDAWINKPFGSEDLAQALRELEENPAG